MVKFATQFASAEVSGSSLAFTSLGKVRGEPVALWPVCSIWPRVLAGLCSLPGEFFGLLEKEIIVRGESIEPEDFF